MADHTNLKVTDWVTKLRLRYVTAAALVVASMSATWYTSDLRHQEFTRYLAGMKIHESENRSSRRASDSLSIGRYAQERMAELQRLEFRLYVLSVMITVAAFVCIFEPVASLLNRQWNQLNSSAQRMSYAAQVAEESSRQKSRFLANMSHEIRTPMNGIIGLTGELLRTELRGDQAHHLTMVQDSATALLSLLDDILDFSKLRAEKVELQADPTCLADVAKLATAPFGELVQEKGNHLSVELSPDLPEFVMADDGRLRQILVNLISNANKFCRDGDIQIRIEKPIHDGDLIRFSVHDTGIGIPPDQQEAIFDEFRQADGSITRNYGGTGLGLAISGDLVRLMGGKIRLESEVGKGSLFEFDIPLPAVDLPAETVAGAPSETHIAEDTSATSPPELTQTACRLNVLVAEDGHINQVVARLILEREGHTVTMVTDGLQAVREACSGRYDLVLMDVQMPKMDGREATRRIRGKSDPAVASLPIYAVTASVMHEERQLCLDAGMDGVVAKPIDADQLSQVLSQRARQIHCEKPSRHASQETPSVRFAAEDELAGK